MPSEIDAAKAKEVVAALKERMARFLKDIYECIHGRPADQCDTCKGRTRHGISVGELTAELQREGLVTVEFTGNDETGPAATATRRRPSLKTIAGIGAAGIFIGVIGWRKGKFLLRAIRRDTASSS